MAISLRCGRGPGEGCRIRPAAHRLRRLAGGARGRESDPDRTATNQFGGLRVELSVALISFPIIFVGELPDKTMFANLVMATRGSPSRVWIGAAAAFVVHVVIAVTVGAAMFALLPHRVVDALVAALFFAGAAYAWWLGGREESGLVAREASRRGTVLTAFIVIFVAEWGDLTQILTANLAARYHSPWSVGVGAILALWVVAAVAVLGGRVLWRLFTVATIRKLTTLVLLAMAGYSTWSAVA
jgi:putative Ca2+/H+ antiporter (TMEM165/GDT1 family)